MLAPANPAFEADPAGHAATRCSPTRAQLTAVLTHHVIPGRLTPEQLAGTHTTLNNDEVTIEGSGESFTIAGEGTRHADPGHGDLRQRADGERDRLHHRPGAAPPAPDRVGQLRRAMAAVSAVANAVQAA